MAGSADYEKKRKFLIAMWAFFSLYGILDFGIDWLMGEKAGMMGLMGGLVGTAWAFALIFWGQRIAARALGFQLSRSGAVPSGSPEPAKHMGVTIRKQRDARD